MEITAEYIKTRVQYGKPLSKFQALQHRMSEMLVETNQARSMLFSALAAYDIGDNDRRSRAVSSAKVIGARAFNFVAAQGIQLHGGIGLTEECAVGQYYKSMIVYEKRLGDVDYHLKRARRK